MITNLLYIITHTYGVLNKKFNSNQMHNNHYRISIFKSIISSYPFYKFE